MSTDDTTWPDAPTDQGYWWRGASNGSVEIMRVHLTDDGTLCCHDTYGDHYPVAVAAGQWLPVTSPAAVNAALALLRRFAPKCMTCEGLATRQFNGPFGELACDRADCAPVLGGAAVDLDHAADVRALAPRVTT